jgi:polyphosphate kinase
MNPSPTAYRNRELSWLAFAGRVIALAESPELPLLERVRFAGIAGMLHDEFFMKRISGLKRQITAGSAKLSIDGRRPQEEFDACREELLAQTGRLARVMREELRPALGEAGVPILDHGELDASQRQALRDYFEASVMPILTPLAVDPEHPFPFISNLGLNLAVTFEDGQRERFVRIKVPDNRPRWVAVPQTTGFVALEQIIAANLDLMYPASPPKVIHLFRVTRGAEGEPERTTDLAEDGADEPGGIIHQVSSELKARRFAGVVRLQVDESMPRRLRKWLIRQLAVEPADLYAADGFLGLSDLMKLRIAGRDDLAYPAHEPVVHPRLRELPAHDAAAIFEEIARGDLLLHHPYHCFDSSVLRFIESAAVDRNVLAIKLTIYRTSADSPIVKALAEAARRGKQVAVLVEVTARFDEAPNIAWGQYLEKEGVHVAYGVERLKTHVKLALVVREEGAGVQRYAHVSTGNYHTGTARIYEDLGVLTCDPDICEDAAAVFNSLTGATPHRAYQRMLVAPETMRTRLTEMIRREAENARAGRPCGIDAKMNQLQDPEIIDELYAASRAGVPIKLNVRGLCCLLPGVKDLSETIRVLSVVGRFLEHSRVYKFVNGGDPEYYIGSADWMRRNLSNRVETVMPVLDDRLKQELDRLFQVYDHDNYSAWDCGPDGTYTRRSPAAGEERRAAQEIFIRQAEQEVAGAHAEPDAAPPSEGRRSRSVRAPKPPVRRAAAVQP